MRRILCLWLMHEWERQDFGAEGEGQDRRTLEELAEWCGQFSPLVGLEPSPGSESLLLDITGLGHLFGGEAAMAEKIVGALADRGFHVRAAVADTIGAAWAVARYKEEDDRRNGNGHSVFLLPPSSVLPALRPLPIEALRLPEETVELLHQLGIWRIEQLEALPRAELSSRFGPRLIERWDQATGRMAEPIIPHAALPRFEARWSPEHPAARRETIEAALEHLIGRVAAALLCEGRGAMRLECRLDCTSGGPAEIVVGLFQATAWARHLFQLAQVQLERLRLPAPVAAIWVAATITAPLERRQQELFADGLPRRHPRHLAGLVDRLSNRLGCRAVVRVRLASEAQPELAWQPRPMVGGFRAARQNLEKTPPDLPPRPLRLLSAPVLLTGGRQWSVRSGQFQVFGRQHRIARAWGPERIETGWWRGPAVGRDYYRVETTTGQRFWLFRQLRDGNWFLHGMFD
jgi:protein ImuB